MARHLCPVCGIPHEIPEQLHQLAYGHQRCCSAHCKHLWRAQVLALAQADIHEQHERAAHRRTHFQEND